MRRKRPYGKAMQIFVDQWDATDHQGKIQLCQNHNISYATGKSWRQYPVEPEPFRPQARGEIMQIARRARPNMPLKLKMGDKPQVGILLCDTHNPFQDKTVLSLTENFMAELQPDFIIYVGDANDFYQISKFDKNPNRIDKLQEDIDDTRAMFKRHRELAPNAIMKLLDGNHEDRLERYLWTNAPALSSLRCLEIEELFGLKEFEIERIPYECGLMINDIFLVIHGTIASVHSGYTAKRTFEKHGGNGLCGHCHRGGSYLKRNRFGTFGWWEGFCLCRLDPDWIMNPDWHQGFNLVHFQGKRFWVEQIPIVGTPMSLMYGGKLYRPEKAEVNNKEG